MANRPKTTFVDVKQAIEQLEKAAESVTIQAVMDIAGGGRDQVRDLIQQVMDQRLEAERSREVIGEEALVALNRAVVQRVEKVTAVIENSLKHARTIEAGLSADVDRLETEKQAAEDALARVNKEFAQFSSDAEAERRAQAANLSTLQEKLNNRTADLEKSNEALIVARTEVARLAHYEQDVQELKEDLKKLQDKYLASEGRAAAAEARLEQYQQIAPLPLRANASPPQLKGKQAS